MEHVLVFQVSFPFPFLLNKTPTQQSAAFLEVGVSLTRFYCPIFISFSRWWSLLERSELRVTDWRERVLLHKRICSFVQPFFLLFDCLSSVSPFRSVQTFWSDVARPKRGNSRMLAAAYATFVIRCCKTLREVQAASFSFSGVHTCTYSCRFILRGNKELRNVKKCNLSSISHTTSLLQALQILPPTPPKPLHRPINPTSPPRHSLQTKRQHPQHPHPPRIQR